jgi:excisionase family DNA binding protein
MNKQPSSLRTELELITEAEACRLLKVCRRQLYSWRMAGLIPYFKIGKAVRFRVGDVLAALEERRVG